MLAERQSRQLSVLGLASRLAGVVLLLSVPVVAQTPKPADANPAPAPTQPSGAQGAAAAQADAKPADEPGATAQITIPPATEPAPQPLPAIVIEVVGSVDSAAAGVSPLAKDGWTAVKISDRLEPGSQIRTGLRSSVNLRFGETTFVSVRSATHASIDQFYRSATTETVRVGLGYGTIRGGSSEGELRSDVIIDSTVATLAKRGTEGWQMSVEPGSGRFNISLAREGLVEAIQKRTSDRRTSRQVRPGEYATRDNIANMWIKQDIFDRNVTFYQPNNVTDADAEFAAANTDGYAVIGPAPGTNATAAAGRVSGEFVAQQTADRRPEGVRPPGTGQPGVILRPDGNFGTGDTFVVVRSSAATKGFAQRSALRGSDFRRPARR